MATKASGESRLWGCEACHAEWTSTVAAPCPKCGVPGFALASKACSACEAVIRSAARRCRHCGASLVTVVCNTCGAAVSGDVATCTVCGADPTADAPPPTPEPRHKRRYRKKEKEGPARPLLVTVLGLVYALSGATLVLMWLAIGDVGVKEVDRIGRVWGILFLLVPGGLLLLIGIGFFTRTRGAHAAAVGFAALGVLLGVIGGGIEVVESVGDVVSPSPSWQVSEDPTVLGILILLSSALLSILGFVLLILILVSKEVADWFGSA